MQNKYPCDNCPYKRCANNNGCSDWLNWFTPAWENVCKIVKDTKPKNQHFKINSVRVK